jgi:hypothetical protein
VWNKIIEQSEVAVSNESLCFENIVNCMQHCPKFHTRKNQENSGRFNLSENIMLKSGYFITILHKNSGKLSTAPLKASAPYAYAHLHGILISINCKKKRLYENNEKG